MNYKLSQHVKERYAQRIMDRQDKSDVAVFVSQHEDKITQDISKMIDYGEVIYHGTSITSYNSQPVEVVLNGHWVLILDPKKHIIITLFEIDLGLGKEFNDDYILKLKEKLDEAKSKYSEASNRIDGRVTEYKESLRENLAVISSYRKSIKALEKQNTNLQELIDEAETNRMIASQEIRETVGLFTGKKVF